MRWAIILLILLGVLAATSAALLVASYGGSQRRETPNVEILVATKALPAQTKIDGSMVGPKSVTRKEAPAKTTPMLFRSSARCRSFHRGGQVVTPEVFGDRENAAKPAAAIADGMVAAPLRQRTSPEPGGPVYPGLVTIFTQRPGTGQIRSGHCSRASACWLLASTPWFDQTEAESLEGHRPSPKSYSSNRRLGKGTPTAQENGTICWYCGTLEPRRGGQRCHFAGRFDQENSPVAAFVSPPTTSQAERSVMNSHPGGMSSEFKAARRTRSPS
jgi:hypothetical protein